MQHDMLGVMIAHGEFGASFAQVPKCARTGIEGVCGRVVVPTHRSPQIQFQSVGDSIRHGREPPERSPNPKPIGLD